MKPFDSPDHLDRINKKFQMFRQMNTHYPQGARSETNYIELKDEILELSKHIDISSALQTTVLRPKLGRIFHPLYHLLMVCLRPVLKTILGRQIQYNKTNFYLWCRIADLEVELREMKEKLRKIEGG